MVRFHAGVLPAALISAVSISAALMAPGLSGTAHAQGSGALATTGDAVTEMVKRTSCDTYGRCFEFGGWNDQLVGAVGDLWQRKDPLALSQGTPGPMVEDLPDD